MNAPTLERTIVPELYEIELEQALIGSVLHENRLYWPVSETIVAEDFYDPCHQFIWASIVNRMLADQPADVRTLLAYMRPHIERLKLNDKFDMVEYLRAMSFGAPSHLNVTAMAKTIADLARRRRIVAEASAAIDAAYYDRDCSPDQIADQAGEALYQASHVNEAGKGPEPLVDVIRRAALQAEAASKNPDRARITTGLESVDAALGGLFPRELHVLGAPPSIGKSGLVAQMALAASRAGYVVAMFSKEMAPEEVGMRYLASDVTIPASRFSEGKASAREIERLAEASRNYADSGRFFIDGSSKLSVAQIRARCQAIKRREGQLDLVVVDHLRLVRPADSRAHEHERLDQITQDSKAIAKEVGPAVLLVSPMNRELWKRDNKRPLISDLYGASAIEYNADHIWFLHREEFYLDREKPDSSNGDVFMKWMARAEAAKGKAEVFSAKRRGGPLGSAMLEFNAPLVRFSDREKSNVDVGGLLV